MRTLASRVAAIHSRAALKQAETISAKPRQSSSPARAAEDTRRLKKGNLTLTEDIS